MADGPPVLIVALSGRALAQAAARAGWRPLVIDLFGDLDTRAAAEAWAVAEGDFVTGFEMESLLATAARLAPAPIGLVFGTGFEANPLLLAELSRGRRLYGNAPEVVARLKDPREFFPLLGRLGLPHPAVALAHPTKPAGWLAKRIGGSGGGHIQPADGIAPAADLYFQRRAPGRTVSVLFAAEGRRAHVLGYSLQWPSPTAEEPFRYGGCAQPTKLAAALAAEITAGLDALVRETGLVGLSSLDLLVHRHRFTILEVNPRPGATLDTFDTDSVPALFELHVAACDGRLPGSWQPPSARAAAVVYAETPMVVPADFEWPSYTRDQSPPGTSIRPGDPVCTVATSCGTAIGAKRRTRECGSSLLHYLRLRSQPTAVAERRLAAP